MVVTTVDPSKEPYKNHISNVKFCMGNYGKWKIMQNSPTQSLQTHGRHFCKGNHCPLQASFRPSHPRFPSVVSTSKWLQHDFAMWRSLWPDSIWSRQSTTGFVAHCRGGHGQSHRIQKYHWRRPLCWDVPNLHLTSWKKMTNSLRTNI